MLGDIPMQLAHAAGPCSWPMQLAHAAGPMQLAHAAGLSKDMSAADGVGFEPTRHLKISSDFQDQRFQPLSHPSKRNIYLHIFQVLTFSDRED